MSEFYTLLKSGTYFLIFYVCKGPYYFIRPRPLNVSIHQFYLMVYRPTLNKNDYLLRLTFNYQLEKCPLDPVRI